jgi:hypothetical protein
MVLWGCFGSSWLDVVVHAEEATRIVLILQGDEATVMLPGHSSSGTARSLRLNVIAAATGTPKEVNAGTFTWWPLSVGYAG